MQRVGYLCSISRLHRSLPLFEWVESTLISHCIWNLWKSTWVVTINCEFIFPHLIDSHWLHAGPTKWKHWSRRITTSVFSNWFWSWCSTNTFSVLQTRNIGYRMYFDLFFIMFSMSHPRTLTLLQTRMILRWVAVHSAFWFSYVWETRSYSFVIQTWPYISGSCPPHAVVYGTFRNQQRCSFWNLEYATS